MENKKNRLGNLYLFFVFIIMYLPLAYLIFYSFNSGGNMNVFESFTLKYYKKVFEDERLINIVINTLIIGLLSSLIATIIGTLGAISIYYMRDKKLKKKVLSLNSVLMVLPDVMMGASFLFLFSFLLKIPMGFFSVLLSHIAFSIPIVVLMVLPRLYALNSDMIKAAEDLGANDMTILNKIILPNISSGIFAGFFMASLVSSFQGLLMDTNSINIHWEKERELTKGSSKNIGYFLIEGFVLLIVGVVSYLIYKFTNIYIGFLFVILVIIGAIIFLYRKVLQKYERGFFDI